MSDLGTEELLLRMAELGEVSVRSSTKKHWVTVTWLGNRRGASSFKNALSALIQDVYEYTCTDQDLGHMLSRIKQAKGDPKGGENG